MIKGKYIITVETPDQLHRLMEKDHRIKKGLGCILGYLLRNIKSKGRIFVRIGSDKICNKPEIGCKLERYTEKGLNSYLKDHKQVHVNTFLKKEMKKGWFI